MSGETTITLDDGVQMGETTHHQLTLRAPTAGTLIDAQVAAERPVATPEGMQLMTSPALMEIEVLRRQIARIGDDISGPMELSVIKRMSQRDFALLAEAAEAFDQRTARDLEARGR